MSDKNNEITHKTGGSPYGLHRVIEPRGVFPHPAHRINNDTSALWDNEILVDVDALNIDSASFAQIKCEASENADRIKENILEIREYARQDAQSRDWLRRNVHRHDRGDRGETQG